MRYNRIVKIICNVENVQIIAVVEILVNYNIAGVIESETACFCLKTATNHKSNQKRFNMAKTTSVNVRVQNKAFTFGCDI